MSELNDTWFQGANLNIKPGNVLAVYTDDGPKGICGQSMSITSPHTYIFLFNSEEDFRKEYATLGRNGRNSKVRFVIVGGDGSTEGSFTISH